MHPNLFHFAHLTLPTFGALVAIGLVAALLLSERTAILAGIAPQKLWDAGIFAVVAAYLLSRLLLIAAYWKTFRAFPVLVLTVPSLTATGLCLAAIATVAWLYLHRVPLLGALDAWAPCASLVWATLALGHFAEGSDPGMPTRMPWGLPPTVDAAVRLHPVGLYVAAFALLLAGASYRGLRVGLLTGRAAGATLAAAGLAQFLVSFLRRPGTDAFGGLDLLQIVAMGMMAAGLAVLARTFLPAERE